VRNLAAAVMLERGLPSYGVQGCCIERADLDALVERLAGLSPEERGRVPGIKPERGDLILAGAVVVQSVMKAGRFDTLEVTEAGMREGAFYEELLGGDEPPLLADVRTASVHNLAAQYQADTAHTTHVARLALDVWEALAAAGVHPGDDQERELLWAAAMLHDVGTAVDYDDHHKHSRYLILNAGLPGYSPRETALIGQSARYHRKGQPALGEFAPLARRGDDALLLRCSAALRIAEQLERSRDQSITSAQVVVNDGRVELRLESSGDATISRWAAQRQADLFERAFGKQLLVLEED
jgi:exopolyphosphatase/guanosine-5'-triphosphate,3'-diphosphate pyrophosphatase